MKLQRPITGKERELFEEIKRLIRELNLEPRTIEIADLSKALKQRVCEYKELTENGGES